MAQVFGPAPRRAALPHVVLAGFAAAVMFYLSVDTALLARNHGDAGAGRMAAWLAGMGILCALGAWGLSFYPWSRAQVEMDDTGLTLSCRGLHKVGPVTLPWNAIDAFQIVEMPRGGAGFAIRGKDSPQWISIPQAALGAAPADVLRAVKRWLEPHGRGLDGPALSAPLIGRRHWDVVETPTP